MPTHEAYEHGHGPYLHTTPGTYGESITEDTPDSLARRHYAIAGAEGIDPAKLRRAVEAITGANPGLDMLVSKGAPVFLPWLPDISIMGERGTDVFYNVPPPDPAIPEDPELGDEKLPVPGATASTFSADTTSPGVPTARPCRHHITKVFRWGPMQEQEILIGREVFVRLEEISSIGLEFGPFAAGKPIARYCVYMAQQVRIRRWRLRVTQWEHEVVCGPPSPYTSKGYADIPNSAVWVQQPSITVRRNAEEVRCFWALVTAAPTEAKAFASTLVSPGVIRGEDDLAY